MSWFGWLTGTASAEKVIETVSEKLDAGVFTEQERAEWLSRYMEATSPQNLARRLIAVIIVAMWAALLMLAVIAKAIGAEAFSQFVFVVMLEHIKDPFLLVMGFYFLTQIVRANRK